MTDRLALRRKLGLPERVEPQLTEEERIIRQFEERMAMGCAAYLGETHVTIFGGQEFIDSLDAKPNSDVLKLHKAGAPVSRGEIREALGFPRELPDEPRFGPAIDVEFEVVDD